DELAHLRVPALGLVAEVDARLEELAHRDGGVRDRFLHGFHRFSFVRWAAAPVAGQATSPVSRGEDGAWPRGACGVVRRGIDITHGRRVQPLCAGPAVSLERRGSGSALASIPGLLIPHGMRTPIQTVLSST